MAKRKRPKSEGGAYTGILADPINYYGVKDCDPNHPPPGVDVATWKELLAQMQVRQIGEIETRMDALFVHFEIDQGAPDAWERLARALADRHVPALQPERIFEKHMRIGRSGAPVALDIMQTIKFLVVWIEEIEEARKRGEESPEDRPIAERMAKHPMFEGLGNRGTNNKGRLSDDTLRKYMHQIRTFSAAVQSDKLSAFQRQLVEKVMPYARKLIRDEKTPEKWRQYLAVVLYFLHQFGAVPS